MLTNYNPIAFKSFFEKKFQNRDGFMYIHTFDFIKSIESIINLEEISCIWDVGSRDGCQALEFSDWFPNAKIYCFEPVPENIEWCKKNGALCDRIKVIEAAVSDIDGKVEFHVVDNGNIGASSLYAVNQNHVFSKQWNQKTILVDSVRADSFISKSNQVPDLLWMDVQGAEIDVLKSFGEKVKCIKAIHTEVALSKMYEKSTLKDELILFMKENNFKLLKCLENQLGFEQDLIFINETI